MLSTSRRLQYQHESLLHRLLNLQSNLLQLPSPASLIQLPSSLRTQKERKPERNHPGLNRERGNSISQREAWKQVITMMEDHHHHLLNPLLLYRMGTLSMLPHRHCLRSRLDQFLCRGSRQKSFHQLQLNLIPMTSSLARSLLL